LILYNQVEGGAERGIDPPVLRAKVSPPLPPLLRSPKGGGVGGGRAQPANLARAALAENSPTDI